MEIDHKIISAAILSLPLIQEGQLSVSGERMCTILVHYIHIFCSIQQASLAQSGGHGFNPDWVRQHWFVEIDHEIFSLLSTDSRSASCQILAKESAQYWLTV